MLVLFIAVAFGLRSMDNNKVTTFYDTLADRYDHILVDWEGSIHRQAVVLERLVGPFGKRLLDCSCGIGTQALGLAKRFRVTGSDISVKAIERAREEAASRDLAVRFEVADMRRLEDVFGETFDVIIAFDNSLPHLLEDSDLAQALASIKKRLVPGGLFAASIRDYDAIDDRTDATPVKRGDRSASFQLWDWESDDVYAVTQFILSNGDDAEWGMRYATTRYRRLGRDTLSAALAAAGFTGVEWHMPADSGYYQPVVLAAAPPLLENNNNNNNNATLCST
ncbi:hypothetical protein CTAYLR_002703 [Chrysophaeum taylorii]|uniref:Methyltransferase domain-containing protein n=1 Tax=Chrysophaeum taylorii TaxID=2483200 RepID=A0AAD7UBJ8_9STRA|nr:hypothetical protein CTAYLR_002703 [Chrysophaeum taylorii]